MEHKLYNRILSALLALVLVLTGFPVAAFAEGESVAEPETALCDVCGEEPCVCVTDISEDSGDSDSTPDIVSVTIQYIYWDRHNNVEGSQTWDPYVAYIQYGQGLSVRVPNKTVPGYETVLDKEYSGVVLETDSTTGVTSVVTNLTNVTSDMVIKVYYKEVTVPYYARYFLQNVYNDLYTEKTDVLTDDQKAAMKGYAGEDPDDDVIYPDIPGFTALFHQPDKIAADGSTVFEVYYDRNYYLINFDLDGGFGTAPVYARYESSFTVATPTRPGYTFAGWELESGTVPAGAELDANGLVKKIPASNLTYKAKWTQGETTYTVVYWAENADPETDGTYKYSYWGAETVSVQSGKEVSAADYSSAPSSLTDTAYFTYNSDKTKKEELKNTDYDSTTGKVIVNGDGSTILNVYFTRNTYELRFLYARKYSDTQYTLIGNNYYGIIGTENKNIEAVSSLPTITNPVNYNYTLNSEEITYGSNTYTYYYLSLTAKYNAYIGDIWPANAVGDVVKDSTTYKWGSWGTQQGSGYRTKHSNNNANIVGAYPILSSEMIIDPSETVAQRLIAWWPNNTTHGISKHAYHIYVESLDDTYDVEKDGVKYDLDRTEIFSCAHNGSTRVDPFEYTGLTRVVESGENLSNSSDFSNGGTCDLCLSDCSYHNNFYYTRNRDNYFQIYNYNIAIPDSDGEDEHYLPYGTSLSEYEITDAVMQATYYPAELEPNAYVFGGWYTTGECLPGTEVDWETLTMPDSNLTVYASWVPVTYDVYFYKDYDQYQAADDFQSVLGTEHGETMITSGLDLTPKHDRYTFVGWFYIDDDGDKVAFNPAEMAVRQELHLYAEWSSSYSKQYTIHYVEGNEGGTIKTDSEGNPILLADDTIGYAFEGTTRTFKAKSVEQLNLLPDDQRDKLWLPNTNSHSILIKEDESENQFYFIYIRKDVAPYTVKYLDATTGEPVKTEVYYPDNTNAVVTERFIYVEKYIPDAFYKTLILSANSAENVIVFYYTKDETYVDKDDDGTPDEQSARYQITHLVQKADDLNSFEEYLIETDVALVGSTLTATELTIQGFTYVSSVTLNGTTYTSQTSGTIITGGLELKLYYTRKTYEYTVQYLERGTDKELQTAVTGVEHFGKEISVNAPGIKGYELYTEDPQTLTIGYERSLNVITFYYTAIPVTINYYAVMKEYSATNFGKVSRSSESPTTQDEITGARPILADGFNFEGWYSDADCTKKIVDANWFNSTDETHLMPQINFTGDDRVFNYYARFVPIDYTITFDSNGGTAVDAITQGYGTAVTAPTAPTKTGYTFAGWYSDAGLTTPYTFSTMPLNGITLYAKWTVNQYTITFDTAGGSKIADMTLDYGEAITAPADPTKTGYTFSGWSPTIPATMPAKNLTVTAQWTINQYTITFDTDGGSAVAAITQDYGTAVSKPADPTKDGHNFAGWYSDKDLTTPYTFSTMPAEDITLYAKWTLKTYTVTYVLQLSDDRMQNEDAFNTPQTKEHGIDLTLITTEPVATGTTFVGWATTSDGEVIYQRGGTYTYSGNADLVLYAIWNPKPYKVIYSTIGLPDSVVEGLTFPEVSGLYGDSFVVKAPEVAGYTITSITVNGKEITDGSTNYLGAEDAYVVITYTPKTDTKYTVKYYKEGLDNTYEESKSELTGTTDATVSAATNPETGFAVNIEKSVLSGIIAGDGSLVLEVYYDRVTSTITFANTGDTVIGPIEGKYGSTVTAPADPNKIGHTFAGWDTVIPTTMPAENLTITAKWTVNQYTITFDTNGGTEIAAITQDYGSAVTAPADPTKTGYTFAGWDTTIPTTMPAENITITAQWTADSYTITYELDGGTVATENPAEYTIESGAITLINPTKTGYTFAGWTGTDLEKATETVTIATGSTGNRSYTATWTAIEYTIAYELDGGTVEEGKNPKTYTIESDDFTLINPTRAGYTFAGWTGTDLSEATTTVTIATGSTGNRKYTATWTMNTLTIEQTGVAATDSGIYEVRDSNNDVVVTVMITGNKSVTIQLIPSGTYTVKEINGDWTWTYDLKSTAPVTVTVPSDATTAVFEQEKKHIDWLHHEAALPVTGTNSSVSDGDDEEEEET